MFRNKNKYSLFIVLFLVMLQVLFCSVSFAVEKQATTTSSPTQISKVSDNKYKVKRHRHHFYRRKQVKEVSAINPLVVSQQSISSSNKNTDKPVGKQSKVDADQKQLNLPDFTGKKYTLENTKSEKPSNGFNFLSVLSSLFFVIILVIIFGWFYNKLRNIDPASLLAGKFSEKSSNKFNILSTATLGQGKNVHLVEINGKYLVIGSTINNINLLTELSSETTTINEESKLSDEGKDKDDVVDQDNYASGYKDKDDVVDQDNYASGYNEIYKEYLKKDPKSNHNDDDL